MRPPNWPAMLASYCEDARQKPFAWGSHDCVSFAAGWFCLMTGRDVYEPWRGKYDTQFGAYRLIVEAGARDMASAGRILFGDDVKGGGMYARGDVVLARNAFGLIVGADAVFLREGAGLEMIRRREFGMAWGV
jgi:hypothetical protein